MTKIMWLKNWMWAGEQKQFLQTVALMSSFYRNDITVIILIQRMLKNNFNFDFA